MEENLKNKLLNKKEVGWKNLDTREKEAIFSFSNGYIKFLNTSKTEREAVYTARDIAESNGFRDIATFDTLTSIIWAQFFNPFNLRLLTRKRLRQKSVVRCR